MRLREGTIYIRLSTFRELLDDGTHLVCTAAIEEAFGFAYATVRDLSSRTGRAMPRDGRGGEWLAALQGRGFHQSARFVLEAEDGGRAEWNAFRHPYAGNHVTSLDARVPVARAAAAGEGRIAALFDDLVGRTEAFSAHAHDTDDDAIQNCESASLLRLGFGVEVDTVNLAANPGRERSLGAVRYCVNALTWYAGEALERLSVGDDASRPAWVERSAAGLRVALPGGPLASGTEESRKAQADVRAWLGLADLHGREDRMMGWWQRKR